MRGVLAGCLQPFVPAWRSPAIRMCSLGFVSSLQLELARRSSRPSARARFIAQGFLTTPKPFRWLSAWDLLPLAAFVGFVAIFASSYSRLPARIAVHWGPRGVPDRWQDPRGLFL